MKNLENETKKLKTKFQKDLRKGEIISFFDWECPPRKLRKEGDGPVWFDFDLDLEKVVGGRKIDKFTELPKILTKESETKEILKVIGSEFNSLPFWKIVADTNWLYLYPKSLRKIGITRLQEISEQFEKLLQEKADQIYGKDKIKVVNFTKLQGKFEKEYERCLNQVLENFEEMVPKKIRDSWEKRLISHVGLTEKQKQERKALAKRVIASYAAEGIIFDLLNRSGILPNPGWISLDEPPFAGETTEILRKRGRLLEIPKIFLES